MLRVGACQSLSNEALILPKVLNRLAIPRLLLGHSHLIPLLSKNLLVLLHTTFYQSQLLVRFVLPAPHSAIPHHIADLVPTGQKPIITNPYTAETI